MRSQNGDIVLTVRPTTAKPKLGLVDDVPAFLQPQAS